MKTIPRFSVGARRTLGRAFVPSRQSPPRRRGWRAQPWVFGGPGFGLPYVLSPEPASAPEPASDDPPASGPDGNPEPQQSMDHETAKGAGTRHRPSDIAGATATIRWTSATIRRVIDAEKLAGGGVYIMRGPSGPTQSGDQAKVPARLYVGETANFARRWRGRLREAFQAGLIGDDLGERKVELWLGTLSPGVTETQRRTIEWVILRLLNYSKVPVRNQQSINERVTLAPIAVKNILPAELQQGLKHILPTLSAESDTLKILKRVAAHNEASIAAQTVFEVSFYEGSENEAGQAPAAWGRLQGAP